MLDGPDSWVVGRGLDASLRLRFKIWIVFYTEKCAKLIRDREFIFSLGSRSPVGDLEYPGFSEEDLCFIRVGLYVPAMPEPPPSARCAFRL